MNIKKIVIGLSLLFSVLQGGSDSYANQEIADIMRQNLPNKDSMNIDEYINQRKNTQNVGIDLTNNTLTQGGSESGVNQELYDFMQSQYPDTTKDGISPMDQLINAENLDLQNRAEREDKYQEQVRRIEESTGLGHLASVAVNAASEIGAGITDAGIAGFLKIGQAGQNLAYGAYLTDEQISDEQVNKAYRQIKENTTDKFKSGVKSLTGYERGLFTVWLRQ